MEGYRYSNISKAYKIIKFVWSLKQSLWLVELRILSERIMLVDCFSLFSFFSLCFNPKSTTEWLTCQCLLTDYHPYRRGTASHQRETENGSESVTYFQEKAREYLEGKFVLCFSSLTHLGVCIYFLINFCLLIVQSRMHIVI